MKNKIRTRLDQERENKKAVGIFEEKLEATGQESDKKAVKWVKEEQKEREKKEKEIEAVKKEILENTRKKNNLYLNSLIKCLYGMVFELEWPKEFDFGVWHDGKGIVLAIKDKEKKIYKRAFKPSFNTEYDYNACERFTVWAEGIYSLTVQDNGIWTPGKK